MSAPPGRTRAATAALAALAALGAGGLLAAAVLDVGGDDGDVYVPVLAAGAVLLVAAWALIRHVPRRTAVGIVVLGAVAFRLAQVWVPPELSDDLYRYLWDGQVQLEGTNPYRYAPESPELAPLRDDDVYPLINRRSVPTIYPPGSQVAFATVRVLGVARPATLKLVWIAADLAVVLLLLRILRRRGDDERLVLLYAWNPLVVLAFAHEGHVDILAVMALVGAAAAWERGSTRTTGVLIGVAAAVKLIPLLLLPAFVRTRGGARHGTRLAWSVPAVAVGVLALGYLPYAVGVGSDVLGFLTTDGYLRQEGYVSGRRFVLATALGVDGVVLAAVAGAAIAAWALWSRRPAAAKAAALLGAALLLTTPYPWYAAPMVALAVAGGPGFVPRRALRPAELVWPLFGVALELIYVSIAHGFGLSTTVERQITIAVVLAAVAASVLVACRRGAGAAA